MARQAPVDGCKALKQKWRESAGAVFNASGFGVAVRRKIRGSTMKHLMKFMAGVTVLLLLSGCMDTATRLWNGGPYISKQ